MLKDAEIEEFRDILRAEQAEIRQDEDSSTEDRETVMLDQQSVGRLSRMDAMQRQAMAQASSRRRASRQTRIAAALQRIVEGEFGFCQDCGEDISTARLRLDATVPTCISCAKG